MLWMLELLRWLTRRWSRRGWWWWMPVLWVVPGVLLVVLLRWMLLLGICIVASELCTARSGDAGMTASRCTWRRVDSTPSTAFRLRWLCTRNRAIAFFTFDSARIAVIEYGIKWSRVRSMGIGHIHILVLKVAKLLQSSFQKFELVQTASRATFA